MELTPRLELGYPVYKAGASPTMLSKQNLKMAVRTGIKPVSLGRQPRIIVDIITDQKLKK